WGTIQIVIGNQLDSIRTIITGFDWAGLGSNIISGIANGISNGAERIREAARSAAQSALNAAKSWLGISSPSRVAELEIGRPFAAGIGQGVTEGMVAEKTRIQAEMD